MILNESLRDLRYAARGLLATPGLTMSSVLVLGLAIAAVTTVFGVVRGVLLRPLPFPEAERLVMLWQRAPGVGVTEDWFSPAQYFEISRSVHSFESATILSGSEMTLHPEDAEPERIGVLRASASFFDVFGITPERGRRLLPADDDPGAAQVALLSQALFTSRFGADPQVVDTTITLDGREVPVVGVLPELVLDADLLPTLATVARFDVVLSMPLEDPGTTRRGSENFNIVARVEPDASGLDDELLRAAAVFAADPGGLGAGLEPGSEFRIDAVPLIEQIVGPVRTPLLVLFGATLLLLGVACVNVAHLVMLRGAAARRAIAIRSALGAPAGRLLAGELWRSLLVAAAGGIAGVLLAMWALGAIRTAAPADLPRPWEVQPDGLVLAAAFAAVLLTSLAAGWLPALRATRVMPADALRRETVATLGHGPGRLMVAAQVAASVVLVVSAGLLIRTLDHLQSIDPGFEPRDAISFRLSLTGERYVERESRVALFAQLRDLLEQRPEIGTFGGVSRLPMTRGFAWTDFTVEGRSESEGGDRMVADVQVATPGLFAALATPVLAGREFVESDPGDPTVVLVDRAFAERFWDLSDAVGQRIANDFMEGATIVGVVESVRQYGLDEDVRPTVYFPHARNGSRSLYGVARGSVPSEVLLTAVRETVRSLDPTLPVHAARTLEDVVSASLERRRIVLTLLAYLAAVSVTLAAVGLYGVLSFAVTREARDLAIRKSLGARRADLLRLVVTRAARVIATGAGVGTLLAIAAGGLLRGLVHGVSATDPATLIVSVAGVSALGLVTALVPARRAAGTDANRVLRES